MPFDVFSAIGAIVRAEATRTTEHGPSHPSDLSHPSGEGAAAHPAELRTAENPDLEALQGPAAEPVPQAGALPPAAPLQPGLTA
ncbi:hypothetical protein SAMN05216371_7913 [Streptomyces sp. TLI_053]|uniref:hypothetical protein n=1 Tax=Streptomyces sp. TLI_053 TaxID=1855352 RepID=UPI00087C7D5E|nr:hypothetical protein [Streptomyces sp. TLI_053]SDT83100.1 hypothetical protein SAMN05216371_7913 [Streptomyces sp. TLI_053]